MSAAIAFHPSLEPALEDVRGSVNFTTAGYHRPTGRGGPLCVFRPAYAGAYDQVRDPTMASRAAAAIGALNVSAWRPLRPTLRALYDWGDHAVWLFMPNGQRVRLVEACGWRGNIRPMLARCQVQLAELGLFASIPSVEREGWLA